MGDHSCNIYTSDATLRTSCLKIQAFYQGHAVGAISTLRTVLPKRRKWEDLTNKACMKACHLPPYIYRCIIRLLCGLTDPTALHRNQVCTALRSLYDQGLSGANPFPFTNDSNTRWIKYIFQRSCKHSSGLLHLI